MSMYPNMEKMPVPDPQAPPQQAYDPPPPYNVHQEGYQGANAPPQPTGQQHMPAQQTVTVVVDDGKFGPFPKPMKCYHCGQQIQTVTSRKAGTITWALCSLLCLVGCFCGCCLIPFCANPTQDIMHTCPNCKNFLGAYERVKFRR